MKICLYYKPVFVALKKMSSSTICTLANLDFEGNGSIQHLSTLRPSASDIPTFFSHH